MKKISPVIFTSLFVLVAWLVCGLVFAPYEIAGFYYWGGFGFGLLGIAAVCIADLLTSGGKRATTEVNAIPMVYSFGYLAVCLIKNAIFMVLVKGNLNRLLIVLNILTLLVYIMLVFYAVQYRNRLSDQLDLVAEKTANTTEIASLLARLLSQAKDPEVKSRLYSFKEKVDYSSNITQGFTADQENALIERLRSIGSELSSGANKEKLLSEIDEAEQTWNMRNAKVSTIR